MAKPNLQQLLNSARGEDAQAPPAKTPARPLNAADLAPAATAPRRVREIHKEGEVNISGYFPAEVKASLRMVQAKTGNNVKECLAEALRDLFRKHNVPVSVDLGRAGER